MSCQVLSLIKYGDNFFPYTSMLICKECCQVFVVVLQRRSYPGKLETLHTHRMCNPLELSVLGFGGESFKVMRRNLMACCDLPVTWCGKEGNRSSPSGIQSDVTVWPRLPFFFKERQYTGCIFLLLLPFYFKPLTSLDL